MRCATSEEPQQATRAGQPLSMQLLCLQQSGIDAWLSQRAGWSQNLYDTYRDVTYLSLTFG